MENQLPKIFLVEDDATMLSLLRTLLQMEGFEVVQAKEDTIDSLMETLATEMPSLALVDVNLRHFNGFEVLSRIRQTPGLEEIQVLMSSGIDYRDESVQAGADGFILKPYMPDELIQKIRSALKV